jgi:hypothetical protein
MERNKKRCMRSTFKFYKTTGGQWFIDLPSWKGDPAELQMVEGADTMLDTISANGDACVIEMSDENMDGAEVLTLIHAREPNLGGGGDYLLEKYGGTMIQHKLWLCAVTEFVFGHLPQKIWFRGKGDAGC